MNRAAFLQTLIGRPYRLGAQGPEAYDCWSLARRVQSALYGRELPIIELPSAAGVRAVLAEIGGHPERARWSAIPAPVDGALVTMARGAREAHVGVWLDIDHGGVIHASEGYGVAFDTLTDLQAQQWRAFKYWTRRE